MPGHLTDSEVTAYLAGSLKGEALAHLTSCTACREEAARLDACLAEYAAHLHSAMERSDAFFQVQRARIAARLGEGPSRIRRWWWGWAPPLTAAALLIALLMRGSPLPERPADAETDQAFVQIVQRSIRTEIPGALRPAALLVAEVERSLSARE